MKQYLPKKPVKRGFKVWVMADSENGYFLDVQVYVGRECCGNEEKGLGKRVVLKLTEPLAGRHHHVFCDNFFSSPSLFIELLSRGTYACGTVHLHRKGLPIELRHARLAKGEITIPPTKWQPNHHTVEGQEDCVIVVNNDTTCRHHTCHKEGRE